MSAGKNLTLFLMNYKGLKVLEALIAVAPDLIYEVISSKDKHIASDHFEDIKSLCKLHKIKFKERKSASDFRTPYAFSVSWKWLIPIHKNRKLIIFHDSLLPKYRGFAPLVNALINKEKKVGVSALMASEKYDEGPLILQSTYPVKYPVKINSVIEGITDNYVELANTIALKILNKKTLTSKAQNESKASYSIWRDEEDYSINWNDSAENILRFIDAVGKPYKGAKSFLENTPVRILHASLYKDIKLELRHPGKVFIIKNGLPVVTCGTGLIVIEDMVDDRSRKSILPLKKLRVRFNKMS